MSTCNWLDLQTLASHLIMLKDLPDHCCSHNILVWSTCWRPMATIVIGQTSWHRHLGTIILPPMMNPPWHSTPWLLGTIIPPFVMNPLWLSTYDFCLKSFIKLETPIKCSIHHLCWTQNSWNNSVCYNGSIRVSYDVPFVPKWWR